MLVRVNHWGLTPLSAAAAVGRNKAVAEALAAAGGQPVCGMHADFFPMHAAVLSGDHGAMNLRLSSQRRR